MDWISVKDALPEKLQKVLFFWAYDEVLKNISMGYLCDAGWDIYLPYVSCKLSNECIEVTHWMPLPDYPEDKE